MAHAGTRRRRATFVVGCDGDDGCPMCARDLSSESESEGDRSEEVSDDEGECSSLILAAATTVFKCVAKLPGSSTHSHLVLPVQLTNDSSAQLTNRQVKLETRPALQPLQESGTLRAPGRSTV